MTTPQHLSDRYELGEILVEGAHAASRGVFAGRLKDGSETRVGFADFFRFDEQGLISTEIGKEERA